eukprot:252951_1
MSLLFHIYTISYIFANIKGELLQGNHRIVGGTSTHVSNYPFIALLINGGTPWCGGSILRKEYPAVILTAAHCYSAFNSNNDRVRLYANDVNGDSNSIDSQISRAEIHWNYDPNTLDNDIALVWLTKDISSYNQLETVTITPTSPTGAECCNSGQNLQVIGYGADCTGCSSTPTLEYVTLDYMNRATCQQAYPGEDITNQMLCASRINQDSCQGDSGGPLIKQFTTQQIGIVSWGYDCAHPEYPGVYTDIGQLYNWIRSFVTDSPTPAPTSNPTPSPTHSPTPSPTPAPTKNPTLSPTKNPTPSPTKNPTNAPSLPPSKSPSNSPSLIPTNMPSNSPTTSPSLTPTISPTIIPTSPPSNSPSINPTNIPTISPSNIPSISPSYSPTSPPSINPSITPCFTPT